jgi:hypothetical protein
MKKFFVFIVLTCVLGNRALAQTDPSVTYVADNISFEDYHQSWGDEENLSSYQWGPDYTDGNITSYFLRSFNQGGNWWEGSPGRRFFVSQANTVYNNQYRISVNNRNNWNISYDGDSGASYFQFAAAQAEDTKNRIVYIHHLNAKDQVTILFAGNTVAYLMSDNTNKGTVGENGIQLSKQETLTIADNINDGILAVKLTNENNVGYPGIRKIDINVYKEEKNPRFDYDPGYEEYDMYDEFTYTGNNSSNTETYQQASSSTVFNTNNPAGFNLNGNAANYISFTTSKISANNRIAVDQSGTWRFNYGLRPPTDNTNDVWSNFSVCNLRVGDRVVVSYMGGPEDLVFSSAGNSTTYDGCAAFADKWNDGIYHAQGQVPEDQYIQGGMPVQIDWQRNEGGISQNYGIQQGYTADEYQLYYTKAYVIAENGHLDFGIKNGPVNRLVKIKIYSDHQAMMVDDYHKEDYRYTAHFNISGELQLKEHIMPGGLEIHIGNDDPNQHAIVVASQKDVEHVYPIDGYVSYVNAVDGYKIPGVTKSSGENPYYIPNFKLNPSSDDFELPTTGTFYRFIPETSGKMRLCFKANSMNYYRWDLAGDAVYYLNGWTELFDRPNEQTLDVQCPYYLVTVAKDGTVSYQQLQKDGQDIKNGQFFKTEEISVVEGNTYYLFGGWNSDDVYFNGCDNGAYVHSQDYGTTGYKSDYQNNIEWRPIDGSITSDGVHREHDQFRACGVAELLWVDFIRYHSIFPLAKWVPNGTKAVKVGSPVPNPDTFAPEEELATVEGYTTDDITVKKMSGNITACRPFIKDGKLQIDGITFAKDNNNKDLNPGGTILIKIGNADDKVEPLYTLTIAYSAEGKYDKNATNDGRGHIWDYSTKSLHGLTWGLNEKQFDDQETFNYPEADEDGVFHNPGEGGYAVERDFGHYFNDYFRDIYNNSSYSSAAAIMGDSSLKNTDKDENGLPTSLLSEEIDYQDDHGLSRSDWTFNYNLVNDGNLYDPIFVNKYDMEGDNADMIWESEGMVFQTSSGQSGIFNEYTNTQNNGNMVVHTETIDPDRYIGIKEGGKFRIPWLMPNDRVIIYMGIGTLNLKEQAKFSIRNAYDAVHNEISESDDYIVGGSHWDGATGDPYYRGCYHFFAKGNGNGPADMVFEMKEGPLCKIYKIQIYRGDRIITNEVVGETVNDKFLLWSRAKDPNDPNDVATKGSASNWTLQYFGKNQKLADNTNSVNNDIVAQTGHITKTLITETDATKATYNTFTYPHTQGEIGTIRVRAKDMEKNMKYVADYGEHNVTIAYQETQKYPYTWDFKDMTGWGGDATTGNKAMMFDPEDQYEPSDTPPGWFVGLYDDTEDDKLAWTKSYEFTSKDLSLWEVYSDNNGYFLRLNSQNGQTGTNRKERDNIFQTDTDPDSDYEGNQVWANKQVVPETKGLWFITEDNFNHSNWYISDDGMDFDLKAHTLVVPNVPADAAVYLRMEEIQHRDISWQWNSDCEVYGSEPQQVGSTDEYIFAIKNNGSKRNLKLNIKGYRLLKLAVSKDSKTVNIKGYASESRNRVIDHTLTSFFTGKNIKAYTAEDYNASASTIALVEIDKPMPAATADGQTVGSVLYNNDYYKDENGNEYGQIVILDGGFHLFVPDMHDYTGDPNDPATMSSHSGELMGTSRNMMKSYNVGGTQNATIAQKGSDGVRYVLSYRYFEHDKEGQTINNTQTTDADNEAFYRVAKGGALIKPNSAYISFPTTSQAKVSFLFGDDLFGDVNDGIATGITDAADRKADRKGEWYSLDGRKLNGAPTEKGLYIVNGKKVLVK